MIRIAIVEDDVTYSNQLEGYLHYEDELKTDGENYVTTKGDKRYHGWGIKSIRYTADHYDGAVYINTDNNWFDIKIAIPKKILKDSNAFNKGGEDYEV